MPNGEPFDDYPWQPLSVEETASRFAAFPGPWWVAGGWGINLFVGRQTREHADIDVLIRRDDQLRLFDIFPDWEIHAAGMPVPGRLVRWKAETPFPPDVHDIWCRPHSTSPWALQILLLDTMGDRWLFRRDHRIGGRIAELGQTSDGVPYLAPEVQLLYKSKGRRAKDEADLASALPAMSAGQIAWLLDALALHDPDNPWRAILIEALSAAADHPPGEPSPDQHQGAQPLDPRLKRLCGNMLSVLRRRLHRRHCVRA